MNMEINNKVQLEIEVEVKIHINRRLYEQGFIMEEMYLYVSDAIRKSYIELKEVV